MTKSPKNGQIIIAYRVTQKKKKNDIYTYFLLAICVTLYAMIICPFFGDFITIQCLLAAVYGNLATSLGFYFNKAKKENCQGGITYDAVMQNIESSDNDAQG